MCRQLEMVGLSYKLLEQAAGYLHGLSSSALRLGIKPYPVQNVMTIFDIVKDILDISARGL